MRKYPTDSFASNKCQNLQFGFPVSLVLQVTNFRFIFLKRNVILHASSL